MPLHHYRFKITTSFSEVVIKKKYFFFFSQKRQHTSPPHPRLHLCELVLYHLVSWRYIVLLIHHLSFTEVAPNIHKSAKIVGVFKKSSQ